MVFWNGCESPQISKDFLLDGEFPCPILFWGSVWYIQLLLKSLNTPADLLSQLLQSISLILRLYACSTSAILIASVQRP